MTGLLLVGHGSRHGGGNARFLALAGRLGAGRPLVQPCFLDHAEPSIPAGIDLLAGAGVRRIAVVPVLLFAAGHAKVDIPREIEAARQRHPGVTFAYSRPLGADPLLAQACADLLAAAGAGSETGVLLAGRGGSDAGALQEIAELGRLVQGILSPGALALGFSDIARPTIPEALEGLAAAGFRRVVTLPCFLFPGVLMSRLGRTLEDLGQRHPTVAWEIAGADGLAAHPLLERLVSERIDEVL